MRYYAVAGRMGGVTAATADNFGATLWNPDASRSLWVVEIYIQKITATVDNHGIVRTSTRGTQTSTVTPDADNDLTERELVPDTGAVLDVDFSAEPTAQGPYMYRGNLPAAIGSASQYIFPGIGIKVPFGTGLGIATPVAVAMQVADITYVFAE